MIHVVVAEDMGLLRSALCAALSNEEDIEVVADAAGIGELWGCCAGSTPRCWCWS